MLGDSIYDMVDAIQGISHSMAKSIGDRVERSVVGQSTDRTTIMGNCLSVWRTVSGIIGFAVVNSMKNRIGT